MFTAWSCIAHSSHGCGVVRNVTTDSLRLKAAALDETTDSTTEFSRALVEPPRCRQKNHQEAYAAKVVQWRTNTTGVTTWDGDKRQWKRHLRDVELCLNSTRTWQGGRGNSSTPSSLCTFYTHNMDAREGMIAGLKHLHSDVRMRRISAPTTTGSAHGRTDQWFLVRRNWFSHYRLPVARRRCEEFYCKLFSSSQAVSPAGISL